VQGHEQPPSHGFLIAWRPALARQRVLKVAEWFNAPVLTRGQEAKRTSA
jgi:hypothetical protein